MTKYKVEFIDQGKWKVSFDEYIREQEGDKPDEVKKTKYDKYSRIFDTKGLLLFL